MVCAPATFVTFCEPETSHLVANRTGSNPPGLKSVGPLPQPVIDGIWSRPGW